MLQNETKTISQRKGVAIVDTRDQGIAGSHEALGTKQLSTAWMKSRTKKKNCHRTEEVKTTESKHECP